MVEGRDWYRMVIVGGPCPDCGLDASAIERADLGPAVLGEARRWEALLTELAADDAALRRRPDATTWSAVEYACHVAGMLDVFAARVQRVLAEPEPELGWWDHEAAADDERYAARSAEQARVAIADGAVTLAMVLPRADDAASWARAGTRRGDERFTVEGLARFAVHESVHHRDDARRSAST
jgi:hypothetical protein